MIPFKGVVGYSRDQSSLLWDAEVGECGLNFKLGFRATETNVGGFTVDFAPTAKGCSDQTQSVNGIAFATIVLSY